METIRRKEFGESNEASRAGCRLLSLEGDCRTGEGANFMEISVNGQQRLVPDGTSLVELLTQLQLNPKLVAVEVNTELVPRERHGERVLRAGDQLEIVTLVGGG